AFRLRADDTASNVNVSAASVRAGRKPGGRAKAPPHIAMLLALCAIASAQQLPDGTGKAETEKVCSQCHELARSISLHQDRAGWQTTVDKMASLGANA